jgi:hypothetical protein
MNPRQLVRRGEAVFKEHYAGRSLSDEEWLDALLAHPILIERPIVVRGERAVLGTAAGEGAGVAVGGGSGARTRILLSRAALHRPTRSP